MKDKEAKKILSDLEAGYDLIADKFSSTRAFMWRDLGFVKDLVKPGYKVLDFGCGNGRLAGFLVGDYKKYVGVDISQKLIDLAEQRYNSEKTEFIKIEHTHLAHFCVASSSARRRIQKIRLTPRFACALNCTQIRMFDKTDSASRLPFKDNYFDIVFSIAVFHHFPSREYAFEIAKGLYRVLKPGGKIIITVWNLWQKQYLKYHQKSNKDWIDANISFKSDEKIFNRYHHPFKMGELENLFQEAGFKTMKTKEGCNLLYIGRK
jgi:ubiquinone/menaquinone biosynthesis C-methylase UbiE